MLVAAGGGEREEVVVVDEGGARDLHALAAHAAHAEENGTRVATLLRRYMTTVS